MDQKLLSVFRDDQVPPIHYRRNSNPDRSSITVNITPPEKTEVYFILKCVETRRKKKMAPVNHTSTTTTEEASHDTRK